MSVRPVLGSLVPRFYLPAFAGMAGEGMLVPTLPLWLRDLGFSFTAVTAAVAAVGIGGLLWNLPAGMVLGRRPERLVLIAGLGLVGASTATLAVTDAYPAVIVLRILGGVGAVSWTLSRQTYVQRAVPVEVRGRAMALFGGTIRVGHLVGPAAGGLLAAAFGFQVAFLVAGLVTACGLVPSLFAPEERSDRPVPERPLDHLWEVVRRHRAILAAGGAGQLCAMAVRQGRVAIVPLYGAAIGLSPGEVGGLISIAAVADLVLFPYAGFVMDRYGRRFSTVPAFTLMGIGMVLMPLAESFASLLAIALLVNVGNGIGAGSMMTLSADLAPDEGTSEFLAALGTTRDLGRVVGPAAVGVLADAFGLGTSAVLLGAIGGLGAVIFGAVIGETLVREEPAVAG